MKCLNWSLRLFKTVSLSTNSKNCALNMKRSIGIMGLVSGHWKRVKVKKIIPIKHMINQKYLE